MYNELTPEIIDDIKKVSDHVFTGDDINADYCKDEMEISRAWVRQYPKLHPVSALSMNGVA